jgi:adenosylcobinamide-phosphate synthase
LFLQHLIAMTIAYFIDLLLGDPIDWPHPVKWMGTLIYKLEKKWNRGARRKGKGVAMVVTLLLLVVGLTIFITTLAYQIHLIVGILVESILIWTTIAQKSLKEAALTVYDPLKKGDIVEARQKLSYIVGRDTDQLDEQGVVRATIETVAENTSDGVTAPLFWAFVGGAPLAMLYRAVNTCDSMVGYKNEKYMDFGWASAKLDDLLNLIPSRLTSVCMLLSNKPVRSTIKDTASIVLRDAKKHPSPNSGWGEAAVAALLGIQLGGINFYKGIRSDRAKMGEPHVPVNGEHILQTNGILTRTVLAFLFLLWIGGMIVEMAYARI